MILADTCIKRPVFTSVLIAVLMVFGVTAYFRIGVDLMPDVEFPYVTITAIYPGADPETMESKIIDKIEETVNQVNGIEMMRSTSMENLGFIIIQFELEVDADKALQDVRDKVAAVTKELPADLEPPIVQQFDINAQPIFAVAVSGPQEVKELTRLAEDVVKQRIQTLRGVGGVDVVGGQEREFKVWVNTEKIEAHGLDVSNVVSALRMQNVVIPGGRIDMGDREFSVKTKGQVHSAEQLASIFITSIAGAPLRIGDVAVVEDGQVEKRSHSAVDDQSAVALLIRKQSGANTVEVAELVMETLEELRKLMPEGVKISVPSDQSEFIVQSIDGVKEDLLLGGFLAIVIILFFLRDWRATFISALALPTSVVATFAFIKVAGFTFNVLSMLALSLSIGMLIDDAIVVIENIYRHIEMGKPAMRAASEAVDEIGLAVLATTLCIVAVFVPVATMKGMIGRLFLQFGLTVAFAVLVSLFVAFTLTPMLSSRMLKPETGKKKFFISRGIGALLNLIDRVYRVLLGAALKQRFVTLLIAAAIFIASVFMLHYVPSEFFPPEDRGSVKVWVEMPAGTSLDATRKYTEDVAGKVGKVPGVDFTFTTIGGGMQPEVNKAELLVNLVEKDHRAFSQDEAIVYIRGLLAGRTDATIAVEQAFGMGSSTGSRSAAVMYNLDGRDFDRLNAAADAMIAELKKRGGYVDLDTTYRGGKPEVTVSINRDRAADLGVPIVMIAMSIRTFFAGEKATDLVAGGTRYDVRVQLDAKHRSRLDDILRLKVRSTNGQLVAMSNLVTIDTGSGPAKIERHNRMRNITLLSGLDGKTLGTAVKEIDEIATQKLGAEVMGGWAGMAEIMQKSFAELLSALILAIIIVYLILAAQFESFLHPFTIMLSLPLSLIGAVAGLLLSGYSLNIMTFIGVIMLMGLVTKNAILLVDYTNRMRKQGRQREEALLIAGPVRLRPILMTTAAMVFGMVPVALALSAGGEMRAPMAVAVIGGLITSMLLTLVVVPVAYSVLDSMKERVAGLFARKQRAGG
ncbi:MAG: efflux RND transporter permease subunit [Pseudomonadota bacterium]